MRQGNRACRCDQWHRHDTPIITGENIVTVAWSDRVSRAGAQAQSMALARQLRQSWRAADGTRHRPAGAAAGAADLQRWKL